VSEDPHDPTEAEGQQGASGADDRIADRVAIKLPVKLELDTAQAADQAALTGNVSHTGMYVAAKSPPPVGTLARFEIQRTDGPPVRGIGEVVWIRVRWTGKGKPPGMGIHFRFLDQEAKDSLNAMIEDGISRGLRIEGSVDTDREADRPEGEEEELLVQHRPYGKPLTMSQPLLGGQAAAKPAKPVKASFSSGESEEPSEGWGALRKWANSPAPGKGTGQTDSLGRSTTPLLGNFGDKAKLIIFGILLLIFLIVLF
jgi:hypothetical protein